MEPILSIAAVMIWIVAIVILYMTYLGYDVRARGFECKGIVAGTLPMLGITIRDYYRKKKEHPVADVVLESKARMFRLLTILSLIVLVFIIVCLFVL